MVRYSRLKRSAMGGANFGGRRDLRGPILWYGPTLPEGPIVDTVHVYDGRVATDARKLGMWVWGVSVRNEAPFYWPILVRDGLLLEMGQAAHDVTLLVA